MKHDFRLPSRRLFLGSAVQGLGCMMVGCGHDKRRMPASGIDGDGAFQPQGGAGSSPGILDGTGGASSSPVDDFEGHIVHPDEAAAGAAGAESGAQEELGDLGEPNDFGARTPKGFSVRVLAESGQPVPGTDYVWHDLPDGGCCFALSDGGHIYVSNSEKSVGGGVGAIRVSDKGRIEAAYPICTGTRMNCQGGATPWGTFLTCEEVPFGLVYECDPLGVDLPQPRPALGLFKHEGVAYDRREHVLYLTEDEFDGRLYRYRESGRLRSETLELRQGQLEVAQILENGNVRWLPVPDPEVRAGVPTRLQVPESTPFKGGEGIWWQEEQIFFTTKGDDRVWAYDVRRETMSLLYDSRAALYPLLTGVDAIIGTSSGELLVAEDGGDMQVVVISPWGHLQPLVQIDGQPGSEITGIAFDPWGERFYFSSQRGGGRGITYEMTGPFRRVFG